jgi:hypothetical protein
LPSENRDGNIVWDFRASEDVVITRSAVGIEESLFHQCFRAIHQVDQG